MTGSNGRSDGGDQPLSEQVGEAANVLLLAPSMGGHGELACDDLLTVDGGQLNALAITFRQAPDQRLTSIRGAFEGTPPSRVGIIAVGDVTRTGGAKDVELDDPSVAVDAVPSPSDLTGIGIAVSEALSRWEGEDARIVACFDTVTILLQYASLQQVFQFLHTLTARFHAADALAHFHMDPAAHEPREISTLTPLFDAVVELDEDGHWDVRTR